MAKLTKRIVLQTFNDKDCILLSDYIDASTMLNYLCSCGNFSTKTFIEFQKNHQCEKCISRPKNDQEMLKKRFISLPSRTVQSQCNTIEKAAEVLGFTFDQWLEHYSSFDDFYNAQWHTDHIFPIKAFTDFKISVLKYAHVVNSIHNIRPLRCDKNSNKGHKYSQQNFKDWLDKNFPEVQYTLPESLQSELNLI